VWWLNTEVSEERVASFFSTATTLRSKTTFTAVKTLNVAVLLFISAE
jgi:hypothetical protein